MKAQKPANIDNSSGFTFIELLVTAVIIALLTTIGVVAYSALQRNSRNARRIKDIQALQAAQEQYYVNNGDWYYAFSGSCSVSGYLSEVSDPQATPYTCSNPATTPGDGYCTCAVLESGGTGNGTGCTCGASGDCSITTGGTTHFCVVNLQ